MHRIIAHIDDDLTHSFHLLWSTLKKTTSALSDVHNSGGKGYEMMLFGQSTVLHFSVCFPSHCANDLCFITSSCHQWIMAVIKT